MNEFITNDEGNESIKDKLLEMGTKEGNYAAVRIDELERASNILFDAVKLISEEINESIYDILGRTGAYDSDIEAVLHALFPSLYPEDLLGVDEEDGY